MVAKSSNSFLESSKSCLYCSNSFLSFSSRLLSLGSNVHCSFISMLLIISSAKFTSSHLLAQGIIYGTFSKISELNKSSFISNSSLVLSITSIK